MARTKVKRKARAGRKCKHCGKQTCTCKPRQYYNVLSRPRKNRWGKRFRWNVNIEHIGSTPITGSFAERIIEARTGATLKGYALIDGVSRKITVHIYY